ncbi:MAG: Crp/Fnr family transcriptional regulator [Vitreimonas sp.]
MITPRAAEIIHSWPLRIQSVEPYQNVVCVGDHLSECCLVIEGFLCRHRTMDSGQRQILSFHISGDLPDLQSLYLDEMDYAFGALTRSMVAFIPHAAVRQGLREEPTLVDLLWRYSLTDTAIFRAWLMNLGRRSAAARIAHLFCELFVRMKAVGIAEEMGFELPLSQTEIADALALSTVHVNRTLQELRHEGVIQSHGKLHRFKDWERLRQIAEFDPRYLQLRDPPRL